MHPGQRRLERVPPEIWQEIIAFACTDGGATGRSVALTSRFFREQSLHVRFASLSFKDTDSLVVFLRCHRVQPKDCRPRIHHIAFEPSLYTNHIPPDLRYLAGNPQLGQECNPVDFCANALEALYSVAARQLRTLCLVANPLVPFRCFTHMFPKLEELTVWNHPLCPPPATPAASLGYAYLGPGNWQSRLVAEAGSDGNSDAGAGLPFPSLRRLHYVLTDQSMSFRSILARLPALVSSRLTHLRLSGITYADEDVPETLARMLGVPPPKPLRERMGLGNTSASQAPPDSSRAAFPNLKHVVLYAMQPGKDDMASFPRWAALLGLLRELERTCKRVDGMRMVVVERSWQRKPDWAKRVRDEWLQRMDGGRGCWVESEAEESSIEGPVDAPRAVEW